MAHHVYKLVRETKTKVLNISTSLILVAMSLGSALPTFITSTAHASGSAIDIHTVNELRAAIENQQDGQRWDIYPLAGGYGLTPISDITAGCPASCQAGWYMPILKDNITINGIGNPVLYGSTPSPNGAWASQDLVAIFGDNVTLHGLTLMPKNEANKTIEVMGNNSTIENVAVMPNTVVNPADPWGGSIYYNGETSGYTPQTVQTLKNVSLTNSGVSVHAPNATINVDNVNLTYQSSEDWINDYRFYLPYGTTVLHGAPTYTYNISNALNNIDSALSAIGNPATAASSSNETIRLVSDLYAYHQITINKPNVTVDAKKVASNTYYTIFGEFDKTSNSNNSVLSVQANGVRINELNIDGGNHQLHGINTYNAQDLQLWRVTVKNNGFSGLNVNRSWVQGVDLTTEHNGWHGVDVDGPNGFFQDAGINHHDETLTHTDNGKTKPVPDLYIDDVNIGTVNDTNSQYTFVNNYWRTGDRAYFLKANIQAVKNLSIKYQYDSTPLADGATVSKTAKPGNNNLVLNFDKPISTATVGHYITTETRPDGTSENIWNGYNNTWLTAGKNAIGQNDSKAEFGYHGNGQYTYTVTVYYTNGTSATSDPISLWFDNQSPVATFADAPSNNSFVTGNFTVSATASDTARLKNVFLDVRDPADTTGNAWRAGCVANTMHIVYSPDYKTATLNCTINVTGLTEGHQYYVRVHASDYAGYGSKDVAPLSIRNFTIDSTAPVSSQVSLNGNDVTSNTTLANCVVPSKFYTVNKTIQFGTAFSDATSGMSKVQYVVREILSNGCSKQSTLGLGYHSMANDNGTWKGSFDTATITDEAKAYVVHIVGYDEAGNYSERNIGIKVDNTAPVVTINGSTGTDTTPTLTGTVDDPTADITVAIDGGAATAATNNGNGTWSFTVPTALSANDHTVVVTATDSVGNAYSTSATVTVEAAHASPNGITNSQGNGNSENAPGHQATVTVTPNNDGQVLGASTNKAVKGDSVVKFENSGSKKGNSNFLGLGWWWLLVVAVLLTVWWMIAARRSDSDKA